LSTHPDRLAQTLAQRSALAPQAENEPHDPPGPGSADARVDLKLLAFATVEALAERGTPAARARLADLEGAHLWAGTIQDGTARGFMVALEEAISLCAPPPEQPVDQGTDTQDVLDGAAVFEGKQLRRKKDLLVAAGGARVRFSRQGGILFVDRDADVHTDNCVCFEDRTDAGTLDGFEPLENERPRIFLPGFLTPMRFEQNRKRDALLLQGRLGRGARGYPCRIQLEGRKDEHHVRMSVAIENRHCGHRLRIRFRGLADSVPIGSRGTPGWERVESAGHRFLAATLVRSCGQLVVGDKTVAVPGAQCLGWIRHEFTLGS